MNNLPPCRHRGEITAGQCVCRSPKLVGETVSLRVCTGEAWGLPACRYAEPSWPGGIYCTATRGAETAVLPLGLTLTEGVVWYTSEPVAAWGERFGVSLTRQADGRWEVRHDGAGGSRTVVGTVLMADPLYIEASAGDTRFAFTE